MAGVKSSGFMPLLITFIALCLSIKAIYCQTMVEELMNEEEDINGRRNEIEKIAEFLDGILKLQPTKDHQQERFALENSDFDAVYNKRARVCPFKICPLNRYG